MSSREGERVVFGQWAGGIPPVRRYEEGEEAVDARKGNDLDAGRSGNERKNGMCSEGVCDVR